MSKNIDDVIKEVIKTNKDLHKVDVRFSKDLLDMQKDIAGIYREIKTMSAKVDSMIEIISALTIFIEEAEDILDDEDGDEYQSNEGWLPEMNNWEDQYEDDDEESEED
jgi:regulator of replication initiation timing